MAIALLSASCAWRGDDRYTATAQRGTVSTDTGTTAAGTLEMEAGVALDWGNQINVPLALKWGATPTAELFVGWVPYQWVDFEGVDADGVGDASVGARWRFRELAAGHPAAAVQLEVGLPVGNDDLSSGEVDYFLAGIVDVDTGRADMTGFYQIGAIGEEEGSGFDTQHFFAVATGVPLSGPLAAYGEVVWSTLVDEDREGGFVQAGVYYEADSTLVFDLGWAVGFGPDNPTNSALLLGLTKNLGRIRRREPVPGTELAPGQGP